jgi:hypothetical protein
VDIKKIIKKSKSKFRLGLGFGVHAHGAEFSAVFFDPEKMGIVQSMPCIEIIVGWAWKFLDIVRDLSATLWAQKPHLICLGKHRRICGKIGHCLVASLVNSMIAGKD